MIRDRIKEFRRVRAKDLYPSPKNWRVHPQPQIDAMRGILKELGWADTVLARELSDGTLELIDGHLRQSLDPDEQVPTLIVDLDQDEANKLMLLHDPLAAMAEANKDELAKLIGECETADVAVRAMMEQLENQLRDEIITEPESVPETVAQNIAEIEDIKRQRRQGTENVISKTDSERYLVIVFGNRTERENAVERLGLPGDERYVAASTVDIRLKGQTIPIRFADGVKRQAAQAKHSGATG